MNRRRLEGQVAWITGAASGIGRATAERFVAEGARVAVVDVNEKLGRQVVDGMSHHDDRAIFTWCDVSDEEQVAASIQQTVETFGGMSTIANCAGVAHSELLHEYSSSSWDELMGVNVKSIFFSIKHGVGHLRKNEHSYVVNIGSISSYVGQADTPAYTTSKGAVLLLSRSIALDYAADGLRCNCVCPGITDTPLLRRFYDSPEGQEKLAQRLRRVPIGRIIQPDEIAKSVVYFSCEDSSGITGTSLVVDGGYLTAAEWETSP